jgi:hypothetical protein
MSSPHHKEMTMTVGTLSSTRTPTDPSVRSPGRLTLAAVAAGVVGAALMSGCASPPPRLEKFEAPLPGSWATMSVTSTGSFGNGTEQVRTTLGQRTWEGRAVLAQESSTGAMLIDPGTGARLGFVDPAGRTMWRLDPPVGLRYPAEVGKEWTVTGTLTVMTPQGPRAIPMTSDWKVLGVEEVSVPAGRFKALKVSVVDTMNGNLWNQDTYWFDVEQQYNVKGLQVRSATNPQGVGTRESVLVVNDVRR